MNLPDSWTTGTLPEIIGAGGLFIDGDWVESKDQDPNGDVRLIQLADVGDGHYRDRSNRFLTRQKAELLRCTLLTPEDILIARMPDPLGRACIFPGDPKPSVTVVDVCIVRSSKNGADNRWLMWTINSPQIRSAIEDLESGTTRKRISRSNLSKIAFPFPPLPEQHRIVNKVEELFTQLDAGVDLLQKTKVLLNQYRQSVLKAAFEGKLTEEWRENKKSKIASATSAIYKVVTKRAANTLPDSSHLNELPVGWRWVRVSDIALKIQYGYTESATTEPVGPRFLRITDIQDNRVDWDSVPYCKISDEKKSDLLLKKGDIVFARTGATVGKSYLIRGSIPESVFASYLIRIKLSGLYNPIFVYYFFQSNSYWSQIVEKKAGIGQPNVNGKKLSELILPIPDPDEQGAVVKEIETHFSIADAIENTVSFSMDRATTLKSSILRRAFQGKLVPQNPDDEPASKLLEKLKAERSNVTPRGRKPRQTKMF